MRLTTVEHSKISSGKVINLISSNFDVIEKLYFEMCFIPVILLQTILATVIIWREFGALSSAGVLIFLLVIPVQYFAGKMDINIRLRIRLEKILNKCYTSYAHKQKLCVLIFVLYVHLNVFNVNFLNRNKLTITCTT
ncbi:Uncharacterised protein g11118 [Pycnogonum litorale]